MNLKKFSAKVHRGKYKQHPVYYFLRKKCVLKKFLHSKNTKNRFKITGKLIIPKCKKKEIIIPLHINNKIHKKFHLNLLIINIKRGEVTRIEPTSPQVTKINKKFVTKELTNYFKKYNLKYIGIDRRSSYRKHYRLCKYVAPAEYLYGKKLNNIILKKIIKRYIKWNQIG
jgi:hypothetical protein